MIGKGVTFDSGGYNLKTGAASLIENMKYDMAGAAAVLGAMAALSRYGVGSMDGVEVHALVAACENMISGAPQSLHPGDVIGSASNLTVEVTNTDAEGRLTLCDAIWFARRKIGADVLIDLATLTGAQKIATGKAIAGMYANDDALARELESAAYASGERLWRMPLFDDDADAADSQEHSYAKALQSHIADLQNAEKGGSGGAITAALFLKRFVDHDADANLKVPQWAHLDVAGPVWMDAKGHEQSQRGATGYGVRLLTQFVLDKCKTL